MNPKLPPPDADAVPIILQQAIGQIEFARAYTSQMLESVPDERWFEVPQGAVSHVAWHAGHLAVSQYGLLMFRIRGRQPDDLELIPGAFRKAFSRGTDPLRDAAAAWTPADLRARLAEVHARSISELKSCDPAVLLEPVDLPWAVYPLKLGAVLFCPLHEQIHAGQVGALRRGLGLEPIR